MTEGPCGGAVGGDVQAFSSRQPFGGEGEWQVGALDAYRKRWLIECLFADSKTRGLNMEDTRFTDPAKLDTLLVVISLAVAWPYASATISQGVTATKKRAHGYRYKYWFRLGFDLLRSWILYQPGNAAASWKRSWPKRKIKPQIARVV